MNDQDIIEEDYAEALYRVGSHQVAEMIVALWQAGELWADDLRKVLREHWDRCEAHGPYRAEFAEMFREAGYVSDTGRRLVGELTIYRGNGGEVEPAGISWTLSRAKARWFALYLLGPRGQWLGLAKPEATPTVWRAKVDAADVLGYFGSRREQEVVVDPDTLTEVVLAEEFG